MVMKSEVLGSWVEIRHTFVTMFVMYSLRRLKSISIGVMAEALVVPPMIYSRLAQLGLSITNNIQEKRNNDKKRSNNINTENRPPHKTSTLSLTELIRSTHNPRTRRIILFARRRLADIVVALILTRRSLPVTVHLCWVAWDERASTEVECWHILQHILVRAVRARLRARTRSSVTAAYIFLAAEVE